MCRPLRDSPGVLRLDRSQSLFQNRLRLRPRNPEYRLLGVVTMVEVMMVIKAIRTERTRRKAVPQGNANLQGPGDGLRIVKNPRDVARVVAEVAVGPLVMDPQDPGDLDVVATMNHRSRGRRNQLPRGHGSRVFLRLTGVPKIGALC